MSLVDEEEVVVGSFFKAFLEAALSVDCHDNFVHGFCEFAVVESAE